MNISTHVAVMFDHALEGNLTEGKDYLELWTAYCDFMRRRVKFETDSQEEVEKKMGELKAVFIRARVHLNKCKTIGVHVYYVGTGKI